jgi:hypothetical protein
MFVLDTAFAKIVKIKGFTVHEFGDQIAGGWNRRYK